MKKAIALITIIYITSFMSLVTAKPFPSLVKAETSFARCVYFVAYKVSGNSFKISQIMRMNEECAGGLQNKGWGEFYDTFQEANNARTRLWNEHKYYTRETLTIPQGNECTLCSVQY